jgi:recombination protein RecR
LASLPEPLARLIAGLSRLPGVGPRSAERIALHIVQAELGSVQQLVEVITAARDTVRSCQVCGALTQQQPCTICSDDRRDASLVCVVERPVDIISIEKSNTYRGKFHVLGGKISPLNGVGPEDLRIASLEQRITSENIAEVVIALPSDVEGDATSYYLARLLKPRGVKVSRIAQGISVGTGLEFADELTLSRAMEARREIT